MTPHLQPTLRRALRLAGWNVLLLIAGLALIGLAMEAWLRATIPFRSAKAPKVFVHDVGMMLPPDTEVRWTNEIDFWTVSRTNHLGFLDREPPSPERAAESCHVTVIGDSFVDAREVPIADKLQVRLEELAARELPTLDVTTSAFGRSGTGQINQLAFYDEYARPLRPRLVVLVFVPNDYVENFPLWVSLRRGLDPDHPQYVSAARAEDGSFRLQPPDPDYRRFRLTGPLSETLVEQALRASWFHSWLRARTNHSLLPFPGHRIRVREELGARRLELLGRRPAYAPLLDGGLSVSKGAFPIPDKLFAQGGGGLPFYTEALAFTAFALDEFKRRTERDGAALVVLASHAMGHYKKRNVFARLNEMAAERGIPVIDQGDFIRRQSAELRDAHMRDAHWAHDYHWNPAGHRWAAQALLEYLKRNRDVCE